MRSWLARAAVAQRLVGTVADVEEPDVVALAVEPAERRLVVQNEVVHADAPRLRGGVFEVHAVGTAAVCPGCARDRCRWRAARRRARRNATRPPSPASSAARRSFPFRRTGRACRSSSSKTHRTTRMPGHRPLGRNGVVADAEIEVVGIDAPAGRTERAEELLDHHRAELGEVALGRRRERPAATRLRVPRRAWSRTPRRSRSRGRRRTSVPARRRARAASRSGAC